MLIMKEMIKKYLVLLVGFLSLVACEKEEDRITLTGGNAPTLTVSSTDAIVLDKPIENYSSLQFQWSNPDYSFSNGVSTHDVNYVLQIDVAGANFSSPKMVNLAFVNTLSRSFTVKEINTALSGLELPDYQEHTFQFRVKATLANGSVPLYSNVIEIPITTYLDVVYPVPDKLFITGAATPGGWMGGGDAPLASQEFQKINPYTFQIASLAINASQGFLFVPVYGNWNNKYGFTGAGMTNNPAGDTFRPEGNDFVSPGTAKAYKITVNFKTGRYSFE